MVTGIGSWPGDDVRTALSVVRDALTGASEPLRLVPYLPELPARGPGAELVGRGAGLLVDLPVDLQPLGWRTVDRPGRDAERTASLLRQDLDELAEAFEGWTGLLKVQAAGPWTLAAGLWTHGGERLLADPGACRDLGESLAEGVRAHLGDVRRMVPGATPWLQLDEPSLPTVLAGHLRSSSGYRAVPAPEPAAAQESLGGVVAAAHDAGAEVVAVRCGADRVPWDLLRASGADAVAVDPTLLGPGGWDSVAASVEAGVAVWLGALPATGPPGDPRAVADRLWRRWREVGLDASLLDRVGVTPASGLAGLSPEQARATTTATRDVAAALLERALG